MYFTYLIQSNSNPTQHYIGVTDDLKRRLNAHNKGTIGHTAKVKPWEIAVLAGFKKKERACDFERYLKSGSGHELSRRRFR